MYSLRSKCAFAENNYDSYVFWSMYGDGGRGRESGRFCGEARKSNVDLVKKLSFYAPDGRPLVKHLDVYFCPLWDTMAAPCPGVAGTQAAPCAWCPGRVRHLRDIQAPCLGRVSHHLDFQASCLGRAWIFRHRVLAMSGITWIFRHRVLPVSAITSIFRHRVLAVSAIT